MKRENLFKMFSEARRLSGHTDYVVIGSLSILGVEDEDGIPDEMSMSIDIDSFTKADPGRIFDLQDALGQGSAFEAEHGFYLDPVSPLLPTLPDGWEDRLIKIEEAGVRIWFVDADDAAVSKYARGDPNDQRWIRAGILSGFISLATVAQRVSKTSFMDEAEKARVDAQLETDEAWFASTLPSENESSGEVEGSPPTPRG